MKKIFILALLLVGTIGYAQSTSLQTVSIENVDQAPLFDNCNIEDSKKCFNSSITSFINKNFNTQLAKQHNLLGSQKVVAQFLINKDGRVEGISSVSTQEVLKKEMARVLNTLPQLKPAIKDGKAIAISYSIPVIFELKQSLPFSAPTSGQKQNN